MQHAPRQHLILAGASREDEDTPEAHLSDASAEALRRAGNRRKVREHRQRLRAQGMRPIQILVPDVQAPEFAAEARRQCLLANASPEQPEIQAFIDSVVEWPDDVSSQ